jgi:hypothetical protein
METVDTERMYTTREAAGLFGVTPETVKSYCRSGRIKGRQVAPKKEGMVPATEIKRLLRERNLD